MAKLQRKELTLFRAAEILNVTVTTLANYLSTMRQGDNPLGANATMSASDRSSFRIDVSESDREMSDEDENNDETDNIITASSNIQSQQNNPDITFVPGSGTMSKVNNLNGN